MTEEIDRLYLWIGYIIVSVSVFAIILFSLNNFASGEKVYQQVYSNDITTLTSAALSSNYDLKVKYNSERDENIEYYITLSNECELKIGPDEDQFYYEKYRCLDNTFIQKENSLIKLNVIKLELKDDTLNLEEIDGISN